MICGAIFDIDGTLLDSMSIWKSIGSDYLCSLGIQPKEDLSETFKTFTLEQSARYYQSVYGVKKSIEEIIDGVNNMISAFYLETAPLKPGASNFLNNLVNSGVKLCIATATDQNLIEGALRRCGIWNLFSGIYTCHSIGKSKNEPDIYRAALNFLGTDKQNTWVFEDALHAAKTAKKDGFPVAAVFDSSEKLQTELKEIADVYIKDFRSWTPFRPK